MSVPAPAARYALGQAVIARYACEDGVGGPGIASCTGTVPSGSRIDTTSLGQHAFIATATSQDGRQTSQTVTYTNALPPDGGVLVAESLGGGGLVLVDPSTGLNSPICDDPTVCGHPGQPTWSPNGRAIAFIDSSRSRVGVLDADGACLWCMGATPLTTLTAAIPRSPPTAGRSRSLAERPASPSHCGRSDWLSLRSPVTERQLHRRHVVGSRQARGRARRIGLGGR